MSSRLPSPTSRSIRRPARWRWWGTRRWTTSAASSTRPSWRARSTAASPRAWARCWASTWSTTSTASSSPPRSWTTCCRAPTTCPRCASATTASPAPPTPWASRARASRAWRVRSLPRSTRCSTRSPAAGCASSTCRCRRPACGPRSTRVSPAGDIDRLHPSRYARGMSRTEMRTRRWKRVEYDRLIEAGFFRPGDPVELLGGQLIVAEPQGSGHFAAVRAAEEALRAAFGRGWDVRGQGPLALDEESEPEPDLAVVPGSFRDYQTGHPSRPVLVIEVSETSVALDREPDPAAPFGWRYRSVIVLGRGASVSPLALPGRRIPIADLLL